MKNHSSKEAYYERLRNLGSVKPIIKETKTSGAGSLIDYKRAADGVAYGIIKENHNYYIKKAGTKQDPNASDFAYIGGLSNITNYQFKSLAEADKQRNMMFHTIGGANSLKPNKSGSKMVLNEDVAGKEIDMAASKVDDLDAAASADATPEPAPQALPSGPPEGGDMADAGAEAGGEDMGMGDAEAGADEMGAEDMGDMGDAGAEGAEDAEAGSEDMGDAGAEGAEDMEAGAEDAGGIDTGEETDEPNKELEKVIGKITNKIRKTEMTDEQVKSYINSFISAFKDKLPEIEIEDRKDMANRLIKVVNQDDIADLGDSVPQDGGEEELGMAAEGVEQCSECGGFAQYAESRGYNSAEALMECGEEEVGNLVSGYANAHNDGQNDGDLENVAMVIKIVNPEILNQLKGDYGHEDYANKLEPMVTGMNESSDEENIAQLNELFGGLKNLGKAAVGGIKAGANQASQAIGNKANQVGQAVGQKFDQAKQGVNKAVTGIKQTYNAGEVPAEVKKLEAQAASLGKQITALNTRLKSAGKAEVDIKKIMTAISQEVGASKSGGGIAGLGIAETVDPLNTEVSVPNMLKEDEEEVEKDGIDIEDIDTASEEDADDMGAEKPFEKSGDKPFTGFAPGAQSLGVATVKPDGAPTTGVDITISPDKEVQISMNESEAKVRKYIRTRLEEKAGLRKSTLNESAKSSTMKKLDGIIDKQFKLYENVILKKKVQVNEMFGWSIKEKFAKLDPNNANEVNKLFGEAYRNILINPQMGAIAEEARKLQLPQRYELLKLYVENGGGTLRLGRNGVEYKSDAFKTKAMGNQFAAGGTQGKTQMGGV